jgi:hypothetical protein
VFAKVDGMRTQLNAQYGPAGNTVSLIASHVEDVAVSEIQYGTRGITVMVSMLGGTSQATLYQRQHYSQPWYPIVTLPFGVDSYFIQGGLPIGTELVAVGQNLWHSRLRSETGLSQTVTQNTTCPRPPCEPIDP